MFNITTYDFTKKDFDNWKLDYDYHYVYILENGEVAYIGETTDIIKRAKEHNNSDENKLYKFKRIHIITGKYAETTPAHHYEALLIKLMRVDNKFKIINSDKFYHSNIYEKKINLNYILS